MEDIKFLVLLFSLIQLSISSSKNIFDYSHEEGSILEIHAGTLSSNKAIIPFSYNRLNICGPKKLQKAEDTLGEILTGERLYVTGHTAKTNQNSFCEILCYNDFNNRTAARIKTLIKRKYYINWYLDRLPAGLVTFDPDTKNANTNYYSKIPLGFKYNDTFYIYNHLQFRIKLNQIDDNKFNVVGFSILPLSIKHDGATGVCAKTEDLLIKNFDLEMQPVRNGSILFTYDTIFELSDVSYASRWDNYKPSKKKIHWTGICISNSIICIVTFVIACILIKNVKKDINNYNYKVVEFEDNDEVSWKQVSGDVFRPPAVNVMLLSSLIGTGVQLFCMLAIILFLGAFGFLNPQRRSNVLNIGILLFCLMGLPGGYVSSKMYRFFGGLSWIKNTLLTSFLFPGVLVFGYIIVDIILALEKSVAAVSIVDILSLFVLWIFCTFPLILIGSFFGTKGKRIESPYPVNAIPSLIPAKPCYLSYKFITFIIGIISFTTVFIELNYAMSALWKHEIYFLATFLWISISIFLMVSSELSILIVFLNICKGDYNWWWRSFILGSSPVIYFIGYSIYYFFSLRITRLSAMVVYFGIMGLISSMVLFISGSMSTLLTFYFLKRIYTAIKSN